MRYDTIRYTMINEKIRWDKMRKYKAGMRSGRGIFCGLLAKTRAAAVPINPKNAPELGHAVRFPPSPKDMLMLWCLCLIRRGNSYIFSFSEKKGGVGQIVVVSVFERGAIHAFFLLSSFFSRPRQRPRTRPRTNKT